MIIIILMLALIAVMSAWIVRRGMMIYEAKQEEIRRMTEEICRQEDLLGKTAEKAAEAFEDAEIASHVYSHRGTDGFYEHSFKAYDEAIEAGSHNIEQDLVLSSDGVLFVAHDLNASGMTGVNASYSSMTAAKIDSLKTKAGFKVLRLSEVFDRYGRDINYVIELKTSDDTTINAFEKIVDEYGFQDIITVQSTNTDVLAQLDRKYPDMPKLLVCKSQQMFNSSLEMPHVDIISVAINRGLMTAGNCEAAHAHDKLFSAWTLSSESSIRNAIDMNVDTYFTNDTPLALSLEREYGLEKRAELNSEKSGYSGIEKSNDNIGREDSEG